VSARLSSCSAWSMAQRPLQDRAAHGKEKVYGSIP
jgi:hypothetical protein